LAKQAILYRAHSGDPAIRAELNKLANELPGYDLFVVALQDGPQPVDRFFEPSFIATPQDIAGIPYLGKSQAFSLGHRRGHEDLPVMQFFRSHRDYDYYWVIEYDVRWSGDWRGLFDDISTSQADLLATSVADYRTDPDWSWWESLHHNGQPFSPEHRIKAFLPFCRLSRRALSGIDTAYETGTNGHYEATWSSICAKNNFSIEDIGGEGPYTPLNRKRRHYSSTLNSVSLGPGTFVFRPSFDIDSYAKLLAAPGCLPALWHPVKTADAQRDQFNLTQVDP
jgi:hypothetical protein